MFTYGIGESAERQIVKPSRARVIRARVAYRARRIDAWLDTHIVSVFASFGALAIVVAITCATLTDSREYLSGALFVVLVCATMSALGVLAISIAVSEYTSRDANKKMRNIHATYRATIARADSAHELAVGTIAKQLSDATTERDELRGELESLQVALWNLAYALIEDSDIREITAKELSAISENIKEHSRACVFANETVRIYATDGIYGYDARLNAKIENGLVDYDNYNRTRD